MLEFVWRKTSSHHSISPPLRLCHMLSLLFLWMMVCSCWPASPTQDVPPGKTALSPAAPVFPLLDCPRQHTDRLWFHRKILSRPHIPLQLPHISLPPSAAQLKRVVGICCLQILSSRFLWNPLLSFCSTVCCLSCTTHVSALIGHFCKAEIHLKALKYGTIWTSSFASGICPTGKNDVHQDGCTKSGSFAVDWNNKCAGPEPRGLMFIG